MSRKALLIGGILWLMEAVFAVFVGAATSVARHQPLFWPLIIGLLIILIPIDLYVGTKMPGASDTP
jgi:hypothetical protein